MWNVCFIKINKKYQYTNYTNGTNETDFNDFNKVTVYMLHLTYWLFFFL